MTFTVGLEFNLSHCVRIWISAGHNCSSSSVSCMTHAGASDLEATFMDFTRINGLVVRIAMQTWTGFRSECPIDFAHRTVRDYWSSMTLQRLSIVMSPAPWQHTNSATWVYLGIVIWPATEPNINPFFELPLCKFYIQVEYCIVNFSKIDHSLHWNNCHQAEITNDEFLSAGNLPRMHWSINGGQTSLSKARYSTIANQGPKCRSQMKLINDMMSSIFTPLLLHGSSWSCLSVWRIRGRVEIGSPCWIKSRRRPCRVHLPWSIRFSRDINQNFNEISRFAKRRRPIVWTIVIL